MDAPASATSSGGNSGGSGALQRLQLREASLPITEDVLRNVEVGGKLADRPESLVALAGRLGHLGSRSLAAGDPLAHELTGAEGKHPARRDRNLDSGFGVAADALAFVAKDEAAEPTPSLLPLDARGTYGAGCARRCGPIRSARGRFAMPMSARSRGSTSDRGCMTACIGPGRPLLAKSDITAISKSACAA